MPFVSVRPVNETTNTNLNNHYVSTNNKDGISKVLETGEQFEQTEEKQTNILQKDSSMLTLWEDFRETTTLHGLKHVRKEKKYQLRWIIWILALLGMGSLLIYNVFCLYIYYKTNPTLTNINVQFVKEMSYPAITICNMSPYKKSAVNATPSLMSHLLHNSKLGTLMPPLNYSNPAYAELHQNTPEDWLSNVSFNLNDMFVICVNQRAVVACTDILSKKVTQWGTCFTYNNYDKAEKNGGEKISITGSASALTFYIDIKQEEYVYNTNMAAGVKIVLHEPEEEPDINNKGFILAPGFSTYVSMKMTKYKYLPAPYKAAGDQYCVDTKAPGYANLLKYYPVYSPTGCLLECRRNFIVGKCGCRAATDPGNETLCSPALIATCYYKYKVEFDARAELKEQCQCMISCEFTNFEQSISTAAFPANVYMSALNSMGFDHLKENGIEVRLYYDSLSYLFVESIPEYNTEDIVGILGGQMGIFLGASLLTVSELLEFVILEVVLVVKRWLSSMCTKRDVRNKHESSQYS